MSSILSFPKASYEYDFSTPEIFTKTENNIGKDNSSKFPEITYYLGDDQVTGIFGSDIDTVRLDWAEIAVAVYLADRVSAREIARHSHNWGRVFELKIAVRNPEFWNSENVQAELRDVLSYYTDDEWEFDFVELTAKERNQEKQTELQLPPVSAPRVALYSGGLDSFAGAAQQLFNDFQTPFIFVSGATNSRQISGQRNQVRNLFKIYPRREELIHYQIGLGVNWNKSEHPKEETTQRTRGFLFITLGAITALNAGVRQLEIYENGIGAINLPYDASQIGTMNSRAVNPIALLKMESLIGTITNQKFTIVNPYLFETKGEMCSHEIVKRMGDIIKSTFSCDGYPVRTAGKPQCGICTSCLLRRLSVEYAGLGALDEREWYLTDLTDVFSKPSVNQLNNLRAMEWQYQNLEACLAQDSPWKSLIDTYPELELIASTLAVSGQVSVSEIQTKIIRLYKQYCAEWKNFSARHNFILINKRAA